ncbi:MAG TPA: Ig-like domain-containing protein [Steroidobacteraceae bacterium]|nr:Ig-like domain-containing protein [Steroidobacteraceae bacterium]
MHRLSITALFAAALLSGCGGSSLTSAGSSTTPTGPTVAGVSIITSSPQIASDNTGPATITALVRDANNNALQKAAVTFSASSGILAVTQPTTDSNGAAIATLSAGADPSVRTITVTATSGTAKSTVQVNVVGTVLSMTGPQAVVQPGTASYAVILKNAGGTGIAGQAVTLSSANKNTLSAASVTTDANGQATFTVTAVNGGADTLTASALGVTATESIAVSTQNFAITVPGSNTRLNLGVVQPVTVSWTSGGAPVVGQTVNFAATRGTLSSATGVTDGTGKASVTISSTTSGPAIISATGTGVSTQVGVDFIATTAAAIAVQASPSTVSVSAQSTITAVVRDAANNLVEGKLVTFSLSDVTGGTLSLASALTNSQGVAQTIYTASTTTSATNGVAVAATVQGTAVTGTATLTVAGKTLFLSFGTGNTIDILNEAQYGMPFALQAIDGAGNPVTGVTVNLKTSAISYRKGVETFNTVWSVPSNAVVCGTEDLNNNGILDPGEDFNNDGKLEPGTVASTTPGSVVTATTATATVPVGGALFELVYPKDHAYWVAVRVTVAASVAGTESSTSTDFVLQGAAADYNTATTAPPGEVSPYGVVQSCASPN